LPFPTLTVDFIFSPENKKEKKKKLSYPAIQDRGLLLHSKSITSGPYCLTQTRES
jgi:hypothetical protein